MNEYSYNTIKVIKKHLNNFIETSNYTLVGIGGSISRGYAIKGSDVDLICISKKIDSYSKIIKNFEGLKIECHLIPDKYINKLLYDLLRSIDNKSEISNMNDDNIMGSKKCELIPRNNDDISKTFSMWRELKKITDIIYLYGNLGYLEEIKNRLDNIKKNKFFFDVFKQKIQNNSPIDIVINSLKLYSMINGNVLSKVLWIDIGLEREYPNKIKTILNGIDSEIKTKEFINWYESNKDLLIEGYRKLTCDFCMGNILKCNVMRCITDYYDDVKKAKRNYLKYGEYFSCAKMIEYIKPLMKKLNIIDEEFNKICNTFNLDEKLSMKIFETIKEECEKTCYLDMKN